MKKIFLLIVILSAGFISANAQDKSPIIILAGKMKNLHLGNDLNVTLVSSNDQQENVTVATEVFELLKVGVKNSTMDIAATPGLKKGDKILVIVNALENLTVGQNTKVITHGVISAPNVQLYIHSGATARIVTSGKVKAFSPDDVDLVVKKIPFQSKAKLL
jgi:hypothetical protein